MELISAFVFVFISILTIFYGFFNYSHGYWRSRGIPCDEPSIPYGSVKSLGKTIHMSHFTKQFYDKYKSSGAQFCGMYIILRPVAIILNLDLVKKILVKDFASFTDRGTYCNEKDDPISAHLFALEGEKWKKLRAKLTPTFTSGKMKFMFQTLIEVGNRFRDHLFADIQQHDELEMKDLCARFTTDVIGTCAFGIECNTLENPSAEFRHYGRKIVEKPRHNTMVLELIQGFKNLSRKFHVKKHTDDVIEFILKVVRDTVEYREKNHVNRNDFMDILLNLKNQDTTDKDKLLSLNEIAAQVFLFFLAGFETSSSTLTFCLYELATNCEIQSKARQIICDGLKKHNGQFSYEMMIDLPYIDQILEETLRKYPSLPILNREAVVDYRVPETDLIIEKGTTIFISAYAIHHDPEYYPNPEKFDPDRFESDEKKKRDSMTWLGFGDGPRNCIGQRFGMMQTRIGLVILLHNFVFSLGSKTQIPLKFDPSSFFITPESGIYLKVNPIKS